LPVSALLEVAFCCGVTRQLAEGEQGVLGWGTPLLQEGAAGSVQSLSAEPHKLLPPLSASLAARISSSVFQLIQQILLSSGAGYWWRLL